ADAQPVELRVFPPPSAAMLLPPPAPGVFDENPAHRLRGGREEMGTTVPVLHRLGIDEAEIGFMDEGRGLERLPGLFAGQPLRREPAQLVVDQRQELLGRLCFTALDRRKDARHLVHLAWTSLAGGSNEKTASYQVGCGVGSNGAIIGPDIPDRQADPQLL